MTTTAFPLHLARSACIDYGLPARVVLSWFNALPAPQQQAVVDGWMRNYELADPHAPPPYLTDKDGEVWQNYNAAMGGFGRLVQQNAMKGEQRIVADVARMAA